MKKVTSVFVLLSALVALSACADETVRPQPSPCVGAEGSPCGPKRRVNKDMVEMQLPAATAEARSLQA